MAGFWPWRIALITFVSRNTRGRLLNLLNLDTRAVGLIDGMDGAGGREHFAPGILYHVIVLGNYRQKTFFPPLPGRTRASS